MDEEDISKVLNKPTYLPEIAAATVGIESLLQATLPCRDWQWEDVSFAKAVQEYLRISLLGLELIGHNRSLHAIKSRTGSS